MKYWMCVGDWKWKNETNKKGFLSNGASNRLRWVCVWWMRCAVSRLRVWHQHSEHISNAFTKDVHFYCSEPICWHFYGWIQDALYLNLVWLKSKTCKVHGWMTSNMHVNACTSWWRYESARIDIKSYYLRQNIYIHQPAVHGRHIVWKRKMIEINSSFGNMECIQAQFVIR